METDDVYLKAQTELLLKFGFNNFQFDRKLENEEISNIEKYTRGQARNWLWKRMRDGRSTASNTSSLNNVENIPAIAYGIRCERLFSGNTALVKKLTILMYKETSCWQTNCGIYISPHGYYGASPDGIILDNNIITTVEIKSPKLLETKDLKQYANSLSMIKKRDCFCLPILALKYNSVTKQFSINKNHKHYKQMQKQMYCTGATSCLYIVLEEMAKTIRIFMVDRDEVLQKKFLDDEVTVVATLREARNVARQTFAKIRQLDENCLFQKSKRLQTFEVVASDLNISKVEELAEDGCYLQSNKIHCKYCDYSCIFNGEIVELIKKNHLILYPSCIGPKQIK